MKKIFLIIISLNLIFSNLVILIGVKKKINSIYDPFDLLLINTENIPENNTDVYFLIYMTINLLNYIFKFVSQFYYSNLFLILSIFLFLFYKKEMTSIFSRKNFIIYFCSILIQSIVAVLILYIGYNYGFKLVEIFKGNDKVSSFYLWGYLFLMYLVRFFDIFLSLGFLVYVVDSLINYINEKDFKSNYFLKQGVIKLFLFSLIFTFLDFYGIYKLLINMIYAEAINVDINLLNLILKISIYGKFIFAIIVLIFITNYIVGKDIFDRKILLIFIFINMIFFMVAGYFKTYILSYGFNLLNFFFLAYLILIFFLFWKRNGIRKYFYDE